MSRMLTNLLVLALVALAVPALAVSPDVRISQAYGGGGSSTAGPTFNQDYVEIFNASGATVDISNWTIEYGSNTGNWGSSAGNIFTFPVGTSIPACSYILVAFGTPSAGGGPLPYNDFTGMLAMSATGGKVALFNAVNTNLACGSELPGTLVDKLSYGTSANCAEGTRIGALSTTTAAFRNGGGLNDTDDNLVDFTIGTPAPRYSGSPRNADCLAVGNEDQSWSAIKAIYR